MRHARMSVVSVLLIALGLVRCDACCSPAAAGADIVERQGCGHCHTIEGRGSSVAPPLDGISKHRDEAYIIGKLSGEQSHTTPPVEPSMSHVHVGESEAKIIAEYLMSLAERPVNIQGHGEVSVESPAGSHFKPIAQSASTNRGKKVFNNAGCIACHSIQNWGGHLAPNLSGIGARRSRNYIRAKIEKGALLLPKPNEASGRYSMPPPKLSPSQIEDLINWLLTLPVEK